MGEGTKGKGRGKRNGKEGRGREGQPANKNSGYGLVCGACAV